MQSDGVGGILANGIHIASLHVRSEISINVYVHKVVLYIYIYIHLRQRLTNCSDTHSGSGQENFILFFSRLVTLAESLV